ncbi:MAG: nucleotide-binding protein [Syntrophales bacterium]|jgi:CheY-like chemotaxis protein|nr:nucleotide-binding protein [Syntrophales bacterium]
MSNATSRTKRAIICDDQEDHYEDVKKYLTEEGYECHERVENEAGIRFALEKARKERRWFDVILIDMDLSAADQGETGESIYNSLSKEYPNETYIIYTTLDADKFRAAISRMASKAVSFVLLDRRIIRFQLYLCLPRTDPRTVFLVHGRDNNKANALKNVMNEGFGLEVLPFESTHALTNEPRKYIYELVLAGIQNTHVTIVLFSDDEEVELRNQFVEEGDFEKVRSNANDKRRQSRGNVLIEAGYAFGIRPNRTIFLKWSDPIAHFDLPTDFAGSHYLQYDNSPEAREKLKDRLINCRCHVTTSRNWKNI